jgi:hypothetical protein
VTISAPEAAMASRVSSNDAYFPVPTIKRDLNILSPTLKFDDSILKSSEKNLGKFFKKYVYKSESATYSMNNLDIVSIANFSLLEF